VRSTNVTDTTDASARADYISNGPDADDAPGQTISPEGARSKSGQLDESWMIWCMESILLDPLTKEHSRQKRGDEYESLCGGEPISRINKWRERNYESERQE
jgi:hypothetical protein